MHDEEEALFFADYALKIANKLGPEYAEAYVEDGYSKSYLVEQGQVNGSSYTSERGMRIRIIKDKRLYTFSTNKLDKSAISGLIGRYRKFKGIETALSKEKQVHADCKVREKESLENADMLKDILKIDRILASIKYIKFRTVFGTLGNSSTLFLNNEGTSIKANSPSIKFYVSFIVGNGKETRQRFAAYGTVGGYESFKKDTITKELLDDAKALYNLINKGIELKKFELDAVKNVVISPEITGIAVHESVGHANEADRITGREAAQAGLSYVTKENLGLRIGSENVTIFDDPAVKGAYGSLPYDEEGVKAKKKAIIDKGLQRELLTNREFAYLSKGSSNGSSRSESYSDEPIIRMSNTYLNPGKYDFEELIEEAGNGVYLKSYTEWNIDDTRSFARYQGNEAYAISNGSIAEPVKNYKLEVRTLDFWKAVKMVGKDIRLYPGSCGKGEPLQGMDVTLGGPHMLVAFRR